MPSPRSTRLTGHSAAEAFIRFSEGDYQKAADLSHAAVCHDGTPEPVVRAFSILRQHAELLDKNQPRPVTYLKFLPEDAALLAKPLPVPDDPDREFETHDGQCPAPAVQRRVACVRRTARCCLHHRNLQRSCWNRRDFFKNVI